MKKFIIFLTATFLIFLLSACAIPEDTKTSNSGTTLEINGYYNAYEFIDPDTGIHYLYLFKGGITPRLNSDGSIMSDK